MEKMKKEECWGTDPVHPQKAFFKQLADLALSGLDKVAERCITGEGARGGKRPRGQEGWFGPRGGGRGGGAEVVGEVTVALDTMEVVVEDVEVLAVVLGRWQAGMALPVTSKTS